MYIEIRQSVKCFQSLNARRTRTMSYRRCTVVSAKFKYDDISARVSYEGTASDFANQLVWFSYQWFRQRDNKTCWPSTCHRWSQTCHFGPHHPSSWRNVSSYRVTACYQRHKWFTLQQDGSIHQVDHGKHGYNKSSRIRTVTLTWSGRKPMIVLHEDHYDPCWSDAAVSLWVRWHFNYGTSYPNTAWTVMLHLFCNMTNY